MVSPLKSSKVVATLPATLAPDTLYYVRVGSGFDLYLSNLDGTQAHKINEPPITEQFGGQFLLDPNEINGWGILGTIDNTNSQDLGNVGAANLSRTAGGLIYPFDVKVKRLYAKHYNSNGAAQAWGWVIFNQGWTPASNTVTTEYILDEVADNGGVGNRDYLNTQNQETDIDLSASNIVIPAGNVIGLGVASPTAVTTNYYVRVMAGYIELERA